MDADERARRILDVAERAPRETGPVTLRADYLEDIARVEALPENQSGADKSWFHRVIESSRRMYTRAAQKR